MATILNGDSGFLPYDFDSFYWFLDQNATYRPRNEMENDERWKQIIPYVLVRYNGNYLAYHRTKMAGEKRLQGKMSIGIGGHVESDRDGSMMVGMKNEILEELALPSNPYSWESRLAFSGILWENLSEVGRVHTGVVFVLTLNPEMSVPQSKDPALDIDNWYKPQHLMEKLKSGAKFEHWSEICIGNLESIEESEKGNIDVFGELFLND